MLLSKIYHKISSRNIRNELFFLETSQFWPLEKIREYQLRKIKRLLIHCYDYVPYYRNLLNEIGAVPDDIKTFSDFSKIPVLTKKLIKQNFDRLISANKSQHNLIPNATGGSTGEPLHFFQDKNYEAWANAARIRGIYNFPGFRYGDNTAILWGAMNEVKEDFSLIERAKSFLKDGEIYLNAFNMSENRMRSFLKLCRLTRPIIVRGYVTALNEFAKFLDQTGEWFPRVKAVVFGAETADESTRNLAERIFKAPSFNTYGGRELSLIASECRAHNGLHEISENNYVEFEKINIRGYENAGNLIITNLNNHAMPFIRYKIGDIGIPSKLTTCSCGRGLPLIDKVIGRDTEVFNFYDGTKIAGEMFIHLMKDFPVNEYQFVQKSESCVMMRLKKGDNISTRLMSQIKETYSKYLPENVVIKFEELDKFEKTQTGKFRFVIRDFSKN
jgi:phenylacetate-CoA ligase